MIAAACGNLDVFKIICSRELELKDKSGFNAYAWAYFGKQNEIRDYIMQYYFKSMV